MRPLWTVVLGLFVALAVASCGSSDGSSDDADAQAGTPESSSGSPNEVVTKLLTYEPEKLTVKAGTTVTWEVSDSIAHTVTTGTFILGGDGLRTEEEPDGLVDQPLAPGESVSFTFDEPGTYTYYCTIHKGMNGEVEVTP